ncbi:serine/threonine-protein kinase [Mycolicibacterium sp. CBMA 226]|uniref:serine/threonine-protein kinase n=1 Tax=Mycolicibacterium sp. CBMA 226 TaxID=2606611 RepID=UPI0012DDE6B4|nr:serine/threonine protein kinase [Mycolicibacterium sp. CBMA 226]QGW61110.1 Serine/threonine-protein kinase PknF [Mycolicibacterium sp.]
MPLTSGEVFAGYRIQRLLGAGGMGEVYLARHPRLPRLYAVKVLPAAAATDSAYRSRFNREADLAADLYHQNIVGVHDRGEHYGQLWIAMDYIDGTDCEKLLRQRYPAGMPIDLVNTIVKAVAEALDYAHQRGLLHRDVKPANILLAPTAAGESRILLADFGIARQLGDAHGLTATNMVLGTVNYAAPEQLMGEPLDGRADQYALAATAYQLLTAVVPFQNSNPAVVISHKLNRDAALPAISSHNAALAPLDPVFAVALANTPTARFESCTQFAAAFAAAGAKSHTSAKTKQADPAQTVAGAAQPKPPTAALPAAPDDRPANRAPAVDPSPRARRGVGPLVVAGVVVAAVIALALVLFPKAHFMERTAGGTSQAPALTFDSMKELVTAYYDALPTNTADAWSKLDTNYQNRVGRQSYDGFWATIQVVKLISVQPRDAKSVTVQLKYFKKDGQTETENRWLSMIVTGDTILIDDSERVAPAPVPVVGEVPGQPQAAAALQAWVHDLVSLSTNNIVAKCWTIAPDTAKRMYTDPGPILHAVTRPGVDGQFAVLWNDNTTQVSARRSEIRSGYACPYVQPIGTVNDLTANDAEYVVLRYLSRVVGKPVNPDDVESKYRLQCNNMPAAAIQLLGTVTSFDAKSIRSNGDTNNPLVTVSVSRTGSASDIHVSLSGGIDGSDDVYCIANAD